MLREDRAAGARRGQRNGSRCGQSWWWRCVTTTSRGTVSATAPSSCAGDRTRRPRVHFRPVTARRSPSGIVVNRGGVPLGPHSRIGGSGGGRATGQAAGAERRPRRRDAPSATRLRGRGPAIVHRQRPGAQCWLLRMVLLALAGQLLPAGLVGQHVVRPLRGALQHGRAERSLLLLADGCDGRFMAPAMRRQTVRLHR